MEIPLHKPKRFRIFEVSYKASTWELGKTVPVTRQIVATDFMDCVEQTKNLLPICKPKFITKIEDKGVVLDYNKTN